MQFLHVLHAITLKALALIAKLGYLGLFGGMLGQAVGVPLPSELMLSFGGYLAWSHDLQFLPVIIAGTAGDTVGAVIAYAIGYYGGRPFLEQFGRHFFIAQRELALADKWFARFGARAVFICKLLPGIRAFASFPAGVTRMSLPLFIGYTGAASAIWCVSFATLGFHLGRHWAELAIYFRPISFVLLGLLAVAIALWLWIRARAARSARAASKIDTSTTARSTDAGKP